MRNCLVCGIPIPDNAHPLRKYCSHSCEGKAIRLKFKKAHGQTSSYLRYHAKLAQGLCPYCGKIPENNKKICAECLSYENARHRTKHRQLKEEVIKNYGGKCSCCGETQIEFLSIDHINGKGAEHRDLLRQGFYYWLKSQGFPKNDFQLLCYNCNCAKGFYGYCPHQKSILETNTDNKG